MRLEIKNNISPRLHGEFGKTLKMINPHLQYPEIKP
jgi:hypothetical protein